MNKVYYAGLLKSFLDGSISEEDRKELAEALENREWSSEWPSIITELSLQSAPDPAYDPADWESMIEGILKSSTGEARVVPMGKSSRSPLLKWLSYAAGAAILISFTIYLLNRPSSSTETRGTEAVAEARDIEPGGNKAVLILGNGRSIVLDSAADGSLAIQGSTSIHKTAQGSLQYESDGTNNTTSGVLYNTIKTPRGGQYQVVLADGSKVWLNAASSLRFPTSFTGSTRTVEVSGEAYFEVAKNKDLPFIVKVNGDEIKVLGTSFNVNAYDDEEVSRTTLLEGSIAFRHDNDHTLMRPGQQVKVPRQGDLKLVNNVDTDEVIAWKRGVFHFESAGMEEVMRQLARWYDVDVVFKGKPDPADHLYADIPRQNKLSDVIKALRIAGGFRIELEGKTITVY